MAVIFFDIMLVVEKF